MASLEEQLSLIDDVRALRSKRSARKGNLKRLSNYHATIIGLPLHKIRLSDLEAKAAAVAGNIVDYDLIQDRIEDVATARELADEEPDILRQQDTNNTLLETFNNLLDTAKAHAVGERLFDIAIELIETDVVSGSYYQRVYETLMTDCRAFRQSMKRLPDHAEITALTAKLDPAIKEVSVKINQALRDDTSSSSGTTGAAVATSAPHHSHSKLRLQLPHFAGDLLKWRDFWTLFSAVIEGEHLSDREKICHLQAAMKSEEAQTVVRHASAKGSYDEVVAALRQRYDKTRVVYAHHVNSLTSRSPIKHTCDGLIRAQQELDLHYCGLNTHLGDTLGQFLTAATVQLMDAPCATHWADYTSSKKEPPDMDTLRAFLEHRIGTLQSNPHLQKKVLQPPPQSQPQQQARSKEKPRQSVHNLKESPSSEQQCPACGENHSVYQCSTFRAMNVSKRYSIVQSKHLCHNCLGIGHSKDNCRSKHTCRECSGKHHTWLHKPGEASSNNKETRTEETTCLAKGRIAQRRFSHVFPMTAMVLATSGPLQQCARAFLDTGSTTNLITSRLANSLKAPRTRSVTDITGITGNLISDDTVKLTLGSAFAGNDKSVTITAHIVQDITADSPSLNKSKVKEMSFLQGLQLADPDLASNVRVDILLGLPAYIQCKEDQSVSSADRTLTAEKTLFGWAVGGTCEGAPPSELCCVTTTSDKKADDMMQRLWALDSVPGDLDHTAEERRIVEEFKDTHQRDPDGRYRVRLPRASPTPALGSSRPTALSRYHQNEKSLKRKGTLAAFNAVVDEYADLGHAELVPSSDLEKNPSTSFYLPMHGVAKTTSSTTKLRVVFDASAQSSSGVSLNDTLLAGPSLYPKLPTIVNQFRLHAVGMSADISKMFREVGLQAEEMDYHRFLNRNSAGDFQDLRMTRLTFGVKCSPYLASQVLLQVADDYDKVYPKAAAIIRKNFYVDDCVLSVSTPEEAEEVAHQLILIFREAQMTLRKWRSSSAKLMESIPKHLREEDASSLSITPADCPKALGVHWNTATDALHVVTANPPDNKIPTKRQVASSAASTYDVMGWFSPATVAIKILLQRLWELKIGWDSDIPDELLPTWSAWLSGLPAITAYPIPRFTARSKVPVIDYQLHGFCDASKAAYGAVVYLRQFHADTTVSISLISSRTRVAPLKGLTIPRLELCGALLLATLLVSVAQDLSIPLPQLYAWCDSSAVLGWLNINPKNLPTFVGNRVSQLIQKTPPDQWRYVETSLNPADLASRGTTPQGLLQSELWWEGPPWLHLSPGDWPRRPDINRDRELPEVKTFVMMVREDQPLLWNRYSSLDRLIRITAWCRRWRHRMNRTSLQLTTEEISAARLALLKLSQGRTFPTTLDFIQKKKELPPKDPLLAFRPLLGKDGLLRVGGRLDNSGKDFSAAHPIILSRRCSLTKLLVEQVHQTTGHAGPSTMLSVLADSFCIPGVKRLTKSISRQCVTCRKVYARTAQQLMGQLPMDRVLPSPPFSTTGLDFAGPLLCKRGNPRKPTLIKTYICIFVCFSTKAVHLELVSDLSSAAFLACFTRFTGRRGCPSIVYSDNGTNFRGAWNELQKMQDLLKAPETQTLLHRFSSQHQMDWKFSPSRAPHFGGLWEAGVKSMKTLLNKIVGPHHLYFEELSTILVGIEATMNSRPLLPADSTPEDGSTVLTPGHFLIGRPLRSPPLPVDTTSSIPRLRKWNLIQRLKTEFWRHWSKEYLQSCQRRAKGKTPSEDLQRGDIVLLKETDSTHPVWPMARILKTSPGPDGHTRVVEILCAGRIYTRPIVKLVLLVPVERGPSRPPEDVQAGESPA